MSRSRSRLAGALLLCALLAACGGVHPPEDDPGPGDPPPREAFHDAPTDGTLWQIVIPEVWSDPFLTPQELALPIPGTRAVAVAAHDNHALALLDDGSVVGWGWSGSGQLGSGTGGAVVEEPTHLDDLDGLDVVGLYAGDAVSAWGNADPALGLGELEVNRVYTPTAR